MALINCPECGRENVSNCAEMCPNCGYGIKAYYERIVQEIRQQEIKQQKEEYEKRRLANVKRPEKPSSFNGLMFFGIFCLLGGVFCIVMPQMAMCSIFEFGIGTWLCYEGYKQYSKKKDAYELSLINFEEYQRVQIREEDERRQREAIRVANALKCPVCGSANTEKISTTDRAVSIALVGAASGKIGKQYKCKNCKHMW